MIATRLVSSIFSFGGRSLPLIGTRCGGVVSSVSAGCSLATIFDWGSIKGISEDINTNTVVLNLVGGTESHKFHKCIHRALPGDEIWKKITKWARWLEIIASKAGLLRSYSIESNRISHYVRWWIHSYVRRSDGVDQWVSAASWSGCILCRLVFSASLVFPVTMADIFHQCRKHTFAILAFLVGILLIVTPGLVVTILVTLANDVQTVDRVLSTSSLLDSNLADQLASTRISFEADSPTAVHSTAPTSTTDSYPSDHLCDLNSIVYNAG